MKKKKDRMLKCEHCDNKAPVGDDVAKRICSVCVAKSMQGVIFTDDSNEIEDEDNINL
jgi:hypothetical protein